MPVISSFVENYVASALSIKIIIKNERLCFYREIYNLIRIFFLLQEEITYRSFTLRK